MPKSPMLHTGRASLCALGAYLRRRGVFAPLREPVTVPQQTVRYRPIDQGLDAVLGMRCGAKTIAQSHGTIHTAPAVQRAFGRMGCAEPSTRARPLHACTAEHVAQRERGSWYSRTRYGVTPPPALRRAALVGGHRGHAEAQRGAGRGQRAPLEGAQPEHNGAEDPAGHHQSLSGDPARDVAAGQGLGGSCPASGAWGGRSPPGVDARASGAPCAPLGRGLWAHGGAQLGVESRLSGGRQNPSERAGEHVAPA